MATIVPATNTPDLFFIPSPNVPPQRFEIVAYDCDSKGARPIHFPQPPKDSQTFIALGSGAHRYNIENGTYEPTSVGVGPRWMEV